MWRFLNRNTGAILHGNEDTKTKRIVFSDEDEDSVDESENLEKELFDDRTRKKSQVNLNSSEKLKVSDDLIFSKPTIVNEKHMIVDRDVNSEVESASECSESEEDLDESEIDDDDDAESSDDIETESKDYSSMTMEDLLKLQEDMGIKKFREKVLNIQKSEVKEREKNVSFSRLNKNRPSEMPLMRKRAPRLNFLEHNKKPKREICRDPRFDNLSGELKMDLWDQKYGFLKEARKKELEVLKKELKEETNPMKKEKLKKMVLRMSNQERESIKRARKREIKALEKKQQREALRQGKKPKYVANRDKKLLLKTMQFEELKKNNKVGHYLQKKERKQAKKEQRQNSSYRGSWRN